MTAEEDPVLTAEWLLTNFLSAFHHLGELHPVRIRSDEAAQTHGGVRRTPADGGHERATRSSSHDYRVTWPQSRPATISARTAQNGCCIKPAWCRRGIGASGNRGVRESGRPGVGASGSRKIFTFRQAQGPDPTDTDGDRTEPNPRCSRSLSCTEPGQPQQHKELRKSMCPRQDRPVQASVDTTVQIQPLDTLSERGRSRAGLGGPDAYPSTGSGTRARRRPGTRAGGTLTTQSRGGSGTQSRGGSGTERSPDTQRAEIAVRNQSRRSRASGHATKGRKARSDLEPGPNYSAA
jgi:hypothetical protein